MKLQRTTLILLVSALVLGGIVYLTENRGTQSQSNLANNTNIFSFQEDDIQEISIKRKEETLVFERINKNPVGSWRMKQPDDVLAKDSSISFLLDLLVGKKNKSFSISGDQLKDYGLDKPISTVDVKLKNQATHQLILGKPDFTGQFIYAQTDFKENKSKSIDIILVPMDFKNAVERSLADWKLNKPQSEQNFNRRE